MVGIRTQPEAIVEIRPWTSSEMRGRNEIEKEILYVEATRRVLSTGYTPKEKVRADRNSAQSQKFPTHLSLRERDSR